MAALAPIAICVALSGAQQDADDIPQARIPALAASAADITGFAPAGWKVEQRLTPDLDRDGQPDLVAVLQGQDPKCHAPASNGERIDTNPRILLVALRRGGRFVLQAANGQIIPRRSDPYTDDPLENGELTASRGVLRLKLGYWRSAGGWTSFTAAFAFRWTGRAFALIGYDREEVHRGSGETKDVSVNFLTGKAKVTTGSIEDDAGVKTRWATVPRQTVPTLETLGDGLDYEPRL